MKSLLFRKKNQYFWYKCWYFSGTVGNIKKWFWLSCRAVKMLLKMRLYESLGQRGLDWEFFQYIDFLTKFRQFWWLCWSFSDSVRNIKKRFGLGCSNSKVLLKLRLQDSVRQKETRLGFFFNLQISRKISIFSMSKLKFLQKC